jgi:hypothetical protein
LRSVDRWDTDLQPEVLDGSGGGINPHSSYIGVGPKTPSICAQSDSRLESASTGLSGCQYDTIVILPVGGCTRKSSGIIIIYNAIQISPLCSGLCRYLESILRWDYVNDNTINSELIKERSKITNVIYTIQTKI